MFSRCSQKNNSFFLSFGSKVGRLVIFFLGTVKNSYLKLTLSRSKFGERDKVSFIFNCFLFQEDESLEHGFSMDRKPDAECEDERDFTAGSSFETAAASEAPDVDCGLASLKRITSQSSGFSEKSKVFGPAARRAKRLQYGGNSFVLRYISTPFPSINMDVKASCEIHWQKKSIKQVLTAMQELR